MTESKKEKKIRTSGRASCVSDGGEMSFSTARKTKEARRRTKRAVLVYYRKQEEASRCFHEMFCVRVEKTKN